MKFQKIFAVLSLFSLLASCSEAIKPIDYVLNDNLTLANTDEFKEAKSLLAKGKQKFLVIPVEFKDERTFTTEDIERINKAFFEPNLSTLEGKNYYSVKEFYYQSSLGSLEIEGEVAPILKVPFTVKEMTDDGNYFPGVPAQYMMDMTSYQDQYFQDYDQDKDGYVDAAIFVYSSETSERNGNFWAWVANFDTEPNPTRPTFFRHMWVGLDFFSKGGYQIDAHTIIHETGHLLGLRDYYPNDNYNLALGGHSMMDYNISDHDPYSKMLLNWTTPTYYDYKKNRSITVTLNNFENTNQTILLSTNWNNSVMDEYLLLEYYTPTKLNELDAKTQYDNRPIGFSESGIKIYHVDSRIIKCHYSNELYTTVFDEYVSEIPETKEDGVYYVIGASNSLEDSRTDTSRNGRYKQIALIENKEYNQLQSGIPADNDSLFQVGDAFDSSTSPFLLNNTWNKGGEISFYVKVEALNSEYATLKIEYRGE